MGINGQRYTQGMVVNNAMMCSKKTTRKLIVAALVQGEGWPCLEPGQTPRTASMLSRGRDSRTHSHDSLYTALVEQKRSSLYASLY